MAACAAPRYFPPISLGPASETYMDAGFGCNNPILQVHKEAELLFDDDREISCIISLGTGQRKINKLETPSWLDQFIPTNLIKGMKRLTVSSDKKALEMEAKYAGIEDLYYRFNVEHGLEDIGLADSAKLGIIRTLEYMERPSVSAKLDRAATLLLCAIGERKRYTIGHICKSPFLLWKCS
jgi:hypothetical protein